MDKRMMGAAILAMALAGCGGGSSSDEPSEDGTAKATSEASLAIGMTAALQTLESPASDPAASSGNLSKSFSELSCQTGEVAVTFRRSSNSGSPFTSEPFSIKTVTVADCGYEVAYSGPVSEASTALVVSGEYESGYSEFDGGSASFVKAGESSGDPLLVSLTSTADVTGTNRSIGLESAVDQGLYFRLDTTTTDTSVDSRLVVSATGSYTVEADNGGTSEGTMTLSVGSEADPFVTTVTSQGLVLDGYYGADIGLRADLASCPNGGLTVETLEPVIVTNDDEPYRGGSLQFTNDAGEVTTVSFSSDGDATVTADDGSSTTLDYGALLAVASPCTEILTSAIQALAE